MSWQRIDEKTYIDDTLVTCAEYQLFIDEMRERGKYYQPDHWTSYHFREGQAREPILGIRQSDAVMFCEWLTKRVSDEWNYSLPTQDETTQYPIQPFVQHLIAYWHDKKFQFGWVGHKPNNVRGFDIGRAHSSAISRLNAHSMTFDFALANDTERARALDQELAFSIDLNLNRIHALDPNRIHALERNLATILDLASARIHALGLYPNYERTIGRAINRVIAYAMDLDRALQHAHGRIINQVFTRTIASDLDLYFDLFTLRERIAGRSPTFEGIRLVKERTR